MLFTKQQDDYTWERPEWSQPCRAEDAPRGCWGYCVSHNGYRAFKTIDLKKLQFPRVSGERRENLKPTPNGLIVARWGAGGVFFIQELDLQFVRPSFRRASDGWTVGLTTLAQSCLTVDTATSYEPQPYFRTLDMVLRWLDVSPQGDHYSFVCFH